MKFKLLFWTWVVACLLILNTTVFAQNEFSSFGVALPWDSPADYLYNENASLYWNLHFRPGRGVLGVNLGEYIEFVSIDDTYQSETHGGKVPSTMEALVALGGIGRKTANVILGNAFGVQGIVVDTHVKRVAYRLAFTKNQDPVKIEYDLMELVSQREWTHFSHLMIFHGRYTCMARKPLCPECVVESLCPKKGVKK